MKEEKEIKASKTYALKHEFLAIPVTIKQKINIEQEMRVAMSTVIPGEVCSDQCGCISH